MSDQTFLTAAGAERLRAELQHLKTVGRDELAARLRAAIQEGDLSENADYSKAKEDQSFMEGRIQELEYILGRATIIDETAGKRDVVEVGATIKVQEEGFEPETYLMVGAQEADPRNGRISNESPIGKALMGKRKGEWATAVTPGGEVRLKILSVE
jgi:transcription elongation factor GreA